MTNDLLCNAEWSKWYREWPGKHTGGGSIRVRADDFEWLWKVKFFKRIDLFNNARTVWPRTTEFGRITQVERGTFLGVQPRHCVCTNASRGLSVIAVSCYRLDWKITRNSLLQFNCSMSSTRRGRWKCWTLGRLKTISLNVFASL